MSGFDKAAIPEMQIDSGREAVISSCPFCDGTLIFGYNKTTGHPSLGHTGVPDPTDPTGKTGFAGCEVYRQVAAKDPRDFLRQARIAGARWSRLTD